jgi:hypothetical protein
VNCCGDELWLDSDVQRHLCCFRLTVTVRRKGSCYYETSVSIDCTGQCTAIFGTQTVLLWLVKTAQSIQSRITAANLERMLVKIYLLLLWPQQQTGCGNYQYGHHNIYYYQVHLKQQILHYVSLFHKVLWISAHASSPANPIVQHRGKNSALKAWNGFSQALIRRKSCTYDFAIREFEVTLSIPASRIQIEFMLQININCQLLHYWRDNANPVRQKCSKGRSVKLEVCNNLGSHFLFIQLTKDNTKAEINYKTLKETGVLYIN